jgi:hypothetical protein
MVATTSSVCARRKPHGRARPRRSGARGFLFPGFTDVLTHDRPYFNFLGPRQYQLFTGADRCAIDPIMRHADVIIRRQSMTHLGGPVEDVAR